MFWKILHVCNMYYCLISSLLIDPKIYTAYWSLNYVWGSLLRGDLDHIWKGKLVIARSLRETCRSCSLSLTPCMAPISILTTLCIFAESYLPSPSSISINYFFALWCIASSGICCRSSWSHHVSRDPIPCFPDLLFGAIFRSKTSNSDPHFSLAWIPEAQSPAVLCVNTVSLESWYFFGGGRASLLYLNMCIRITWTVCWSTKWLALTPQRFWGPHIKNSQFFIRVWLEAAPGGSGYMCT